MEVKMNCELNINHKNVAKKFKEATVNCPVFAKQEVGMHVLGVLCVNCCLRIQMVLDMRNEMIRDTKVSPEDIKLDPNCFVNRLDGIFKEYGEIVPRDSYFNWTQIAFECGRCKAGQSKPIADAPPTEMHYVGRNELRTRL